MDIPKELGLEALTETLPEPYPYYPVKRRGQKRVLNPDWKAIRALEQDQAEDCEIDYVQTQAEDGPEAGLAYTFAYGRVSKSYPRPMFQVIHDEAFSGFRGISGTACSCGDFSRTVNCPDHPELPWDPDRRRWVRPCTGESSTCECDTCRQSRVVVYTEPEPPRRQPDGQPTLYDRLVEMYGQRMPWEGQLVEATPRPYIDASPGNPVRLTRSPVHDPETCQTCGWIRRTLGGNLAEQQAIQAAMPQYIDNEERLRRATGPTRITVQDTAFGGGSFTYELEDGDDGRLTW